MIKFLIIEGLILSQRKNPAFYFCQWSSRVLALIKKNNPHNKFCFLPFFAFEFKQLFYQGFYLYLDAKNLPRSQVLDKISTRLTTLLIALTFFLRQRLFSSDPIKFSKNMTYKIFLNKIFLKGKNSKPSWKHIIKKQKPNDLH